MVPTRLRVLLGERSLAREATVAVLAFGAFILWIEALSPVARAAVETIQPDAFASSDLGALTAVALTTNSVLVAGAVAFGLAYARLRGRHISVSLPGRADAGVVASAVLVPVAAVAAVAAIASATGTTLAALDNTSYAHDPRPLVPAVVTLLAISVNLPAYVVVTHVVVQRTLRAAGRPLVAVGATTLLVGTIGPENVVGTGLPARTVAVSLLLGASIALPAVAAEAFDSEWLPLVCAGPLVVFAGGILVNWVGQMDGTAAGGFALAELVVVGVGAYGYEQTDSLVVPALTYVAFVVTVDAVAFALGTGVAP